MWWCNFIVSRDRLNHVWHIPTLFFNLKLVWNWYESSCNHVQTHTDGHTCGYEWDYGRELNDEFLAWEEIRFARAATRGLLLINREWKDLILCAACPPIYMLKSLWNWHEFSCNHVLVHKWPYLRQWVKLRVWSLKCVGFWNEKNLGFQVSVDW